MRSWDSSGVGEVVPGAMLAESKRVAGPAVSKANDLPWNLDNLSATFCPSCVYVCRCIAGCRFARPAAEERELSKPAALLVLLFLISSLASFHLYRSPHSASCSNPPSFLNVRDLPAQYPPSLSRARLDRSSRRLLLFPSLLHFLPRTLLSPGQLQWTGPVAPVL